MSKQFSSTSLSAVLNSDYRPRVLVVGDVMLDRYWFGDANRISPEAPVPIVKVGKTENRLGGAANVARNAAALGADVALVSIVGDDEAGALLESMLMEQGVDCALVESEGFPTIVKLRVLGGQQQLLRIDFEEATEIEAQSAVLQRFTEQVSLADVVVVSDYAKGSLVHVEKMIRLARQLGKPVLVDPKGDEYAKYSGATVLTPNKSEFRQVAGRWQSESELQAKAQRLREELQLEYLLVTRSEEGMSLFSSNGVIHDAAKAKEVFDVSGAGDTVLATLAVMLGRGVTMAEAMHIANLAAGVVVGKLGTACIVKEELIAVLDDFENSIQEIYGDRPLRSTAVS